jgi:hypothetical protein
VGEEHDDDCHDTCSKRVHCDYCCAVALVVRALSRPRYVRDVRVAVKLPESQSLLVVQRESEGSLEMPATTHWNELSRLEQRLLTRLFGGGSLRNQNPEIISRLLQRELVDDEGRLTVPGLHLFIGAAREQQADARRRKGIA